MRALPETVNVYQYPRGVDYNSFKNEPIPAFPNDLPVKIKG